MYIFIYIYICVCAYVLYIFISIPSDGRSQTETVHGYIYIYIYIFTARMRIHAGIIKYIIFICAYSPNVLNTLIIVQATASPGQTPTKSPIIGVSSTPWPDTSSPSPTPKPMCPGPDYGWRYSPVFIIHFYLFLCTFNLKAFTNMHTHTRTHAN